MKKFIQIEYDEIDSRQKLPEAEQELLIKAEESMKKAYAPYSHFQVGAAVRLDDGSIVSGNNQENVAYPSGLCAERVALFAAKAQFPELDVREIAIIAHAQDFNLDHPVSPCGACRQVMAEYEHLAEDKIKIILSGPDGKVWRFMGIDSLLPMLFFEKKLKKNS